MHDHTDFPRNINHPLGAAVAGMPPSKEDVDRLLASVRADIEAYERGDQLHFEEAVEPEEYEEVRLDQDPWDESPESKAAYEQLEREHDAAFVAPPPKPDQSNGHNTDRGPDFKGFITLAEFLARMQPPDYLADGLLLKGSTYTLTGNTGHCKTMLLILLAIKVATGHWFCGRRCKQGTVIFFAGENPDNVRVQFYSMCWELGIDPVDISPKICFHEGVFDLKKTRQKVRAAVAKYPDLALVAVDSLQAFFMGDDDNVNMAMLKLAIDFRQITIAHPNKPTCLITAHPIKNAGRDQLLPRGGSALTNELDGNLTAWMEDNAVTLHWLGKLRGIPFEPLQLEQVVVKPEGLVDAAGSQMPATILRVLGETRETELKRETNRVEVAILAAIKNNPDVSQRDLATEASTSKTTVQRTIGSFKQKKWLRDYSGKLKLTAEGEKALKIALE